MASVFNLRGTHSPFFAIGKRGPQIRQGVITPNNADGTDGDIYIQHGTGSERLYQKIQGVWVPFKKEYIDITTATSTPYSVSTSDETILVNQTIPTPSSVVLPASPPVGKLFIVKDAKGDATVNNITVTVASSGTIDGLPSQVIKVNYEAMQLLWNGTEYNIV